MAATDVARTNGNGNGASSPETPPRNVTRQESFSGTPRDREGITYPDEYLRELAHPQKRMEFFEEMQNDGAIATAIQNRCQAVYAANWGLSTEDDSPEGEERREYVEEELAPHLENLLRWLAHGPLGYGFAAIEPVFEWKDGKDGARRLGIKKLAHIRQVAVTDIRITPTGELDVIHQEVWTGTKTEKKDIPAWKLLFRSYDREGADFYGRPPLRHLWREYNYKKQLEKCNLQHFDRFGVGIPIVTEPEGGLSGPERTQVDQWLDNLRAGKSNRGRKPFGSTFEIVTASGELSSAGLAWVKQYELQIAKVYGTQQTELGSTETGSRAVGETHDEQMQSFVQADAEEIAAIILEGLIKPLVDWNFGPQEIYPTFTPSQRVKATSGQVDNVQKAINAKLITPEPEDEVWARDALELTAIPLEEIKKRRDERELKAAAIAEATKGAQPPGADRVDPPSRKPDDRPPLQRAASQERTAIVRALSAEMAAGAPTPAVRGESSHRTAEFSEWEERILQPSMLARQLDLESTRTTAEVGDVLRAIDDELARQAERIVEQGASALAAFNPRVPDKLRRSLTDSLMAAVERVRELGTIAVRREIRLQLGPAGVGPQRTPIPKLWGPAAFSRLGRALKRIIALQQTEDGANVRDVQLEAEVRRAVEEEIDRREQSTRGAISIAIGQAAGLAVAKLASVLSTALRSALENLSVGRTEDNVQRVVNTAFGVGRADAAEAINESATAVREERPGGRSGISDPETGEPIELVAKIYSAVMDFGTCDECAKWDGARFPIDYPEDVTGVQAPNPRCAGGARCRCVWIYVTDQEEAAQTPEAKGPVPLSQIVEAETEKRITALRAQFDEQVTQLRAELAKPDAEPQPISISLTLEAPKSGSKRVEMIKADGSKITADVTESHE